MFRYVDRLILMSPAPSSFVLGATPLPDALQRTRKVLFASAHSIVDFSNGASVATLDVLQGLAMSGFDAQAFCTPKLGLSHEACFIWFLRSAWECRLGRSRVRGSPPIARSVEDGIPTGTVETSRILRGGDRRGVSSKPFRYIHPVHSLQMLPILE
jgi:hypothetical protein